MTRAAVRSPAGGRTRPQGAVDRTLALLDPRRRPRRPDLGRGWVDLLGDADPTGAHPGQRLMTSRALPQVYEHAWRPAAGFVLMGAMGPGMAGERRLARRMLGLMPGDTVLDVACGTGSFTRDFARVAGPDGLAVRLDASATMLDRALREPLPENLAYVRAGAEELPFADASFDAVCCFAALYLIEDPMRAITELARVLKPGGRIALLSSCHRGPLPAHRTAPLVRALTGVRMFGREELVDALEDVGIEDLEQQVSGLAQFVCGRSAPAAARAAA